MNDAIEALAIGFSVTLIFSIPFAFFAFIRYLRYKETVTLAERGLLRPERHNGNGNTLRWGIVITFLGLALTCGLIPFGFIGGMHFPLGLGPWMLFGFLPLAFGLALLTIHYVTQQEAAQDRPGDSGASMDDDVDPIPPHKQ